MFFQEYISSRAATCVWCLTRKQACSRFNSCSLAHSPMMVVFHCPVARQEVDAAPPHVQLAAHSSPTDIQAQVEGQVPLESAIEGAVVQLAAAARQAQAGPPSCWVQDMFGSIDTTDQNPIMTGSASRLGIVLP